MTGRLSTLRFAALALILFAAACSPPGEVEQAAEEAEQSEETEAATAAPTTAEPTITTEPATTEPATTETTGDVEPTATTAPTEVEPIKVGIVTFLTGGAAEPFGIPARDAARTIIDRLNAGEGPPGYEEVGIGGRPIEMVLVDENGGAEAQVTEYRRLVLDEEVDVIVGYISSGDCSAIAPVAEELQTLTVFFDCGTNAIFEEINPEPTYVFRTSGHQILDSVGAARYLADSFPDARTVAGINQNYAWGQDSWAAFSTSFQGLVEGSELVDPLFPELYAGAYSAEISTLLSEQPDIIHSSFWGGDLESFVVQAVPRGLQTQSTLVLTAADTLLPVLGDQVPPGVVVGARGPHGAMAPDNPLNDWLIETYQEFVGVRPVYPAYHMAQGILGTKTAYELAMAETGGTPSPEDVVAAFEGIEFETPSGTIAMALSSGHQAVEPAVYGTTGAFDEATGEPALENVVSYPATCVNPPEGVGSIEWIESGFEGAEC